MENLKNKTIKELERIKENLERQTNEENYCDITNTLIDYDNEAQDNLYLDDHFHEMLEIVDEETMQYYLDYQFKNFGMERAFYIFRGIDYSDSIYKINAYGNLENVSNEDFEMCIDEAIETLKKSMEVNNE